MFVKIENVNVKFCLISQLTPDGKRSVTNSKSDAEDSINQNVSGAAVGATAIPKSAKAAEEDFFEMLTRTQSKRIDDQRCSLKVIAPPQPPTSHTNREPAIRRPLVQQNSLPATLLTPAAAASTAAATAAQTKENRNALLEMIADLQSERMDEQRAQLPQLQQLPQLPGLIASPQNQQTRRNLLANQAQASNRREPAPDDAFLDMLMRCQGSRLEEQRSELPRPTVTHDMEQGEPPNNNRRNCINHNVNAGATVPDEDFFSLIMRVQGGRMEDQRAAVSIQLKQNSTDLQWELDRNNCFPLSFVGAI